MATKTLEERIQELEDKEAIREVLARYGFTYDLGRKEEWYELFTDDAVYNSVESTGTPNVMNNKKDIMTRFGPDAKRPGATQHMQVATIIKVNGDEARAIGFQVCTSHLTTHEANISEGPIILLRTGVRSWRLKRIDGEWLITETVSRIMKDEKGCREVLPADW